MQAQLIVEKFGPIEKVELNLRNVNVFIGPQASGKSALAKIYTICKSPLSFLEQTNTGSIKNGSNVEHFKKMLEEYNILSYLNDDTYINFDSELHHFAYKNGEITYDRKFLKKIQQLEEHSKANLELAKTDIINILIEFHHKLLYFEFFLRDFFNLDKVLPADKLKKYLSEQHISNEQLSAIIGKIRAIENDLSSNIALYIPAERNFIPIIKGATLNLLNNNVPIPKHILSFGAEFEKASYAKKELDLSFLKEGLKYKNENGMDSIYFSPGKSIKLTESASGLQSIVPLLLPILSKRETDTISHKSFVIEEPELNLFPKAQYELIKVLETGRFSPFSDLQDIGTIHTYTTHSPFILSAFNNLLYASKVMDLVLLNDNNIGSFENWNAAYEKINEKIKRILPTLIDPSNFSAYQIHKGGASSIFNENTGLIADNYIDEASDEIGDDFDALLELTNEPL